MCICNGLDLIVLKLGEEKLRTLRCLKKTPVFYLADHDLLLFPPIYFHQKFGQTLIPPHIFSTSQNPLPYFNFSTD